jgi:galactose mutarotase-like enzyme
VIVLSAGSLVARWHPESGMVCSSLTDDGLELLGQRGGLADWRARGKTFGIPLLHPWANRLSGWGYGDITFPRDAGVVTVDENNLPNHGLLHGDVEWEVVSADDLRLVAALDFDHPVWLALFPALHRLEVAAELDAGGLTIVTQVRCTGDVAVPLSFGWHPYLQLPGAPWGEWSIATSVRARMLLDERGIPTGEVVDEPVPDGPLAGRAFDHAYASAAGATFSVSGGGRRLGVRFGEGYTHAQLFASPELEVLAFEPMTAPVNALRTGDALRAVAPGEAFRAVFRIDVTRTARGAAAPG